QYQNAYTKSLRNRARTLLDVAFTGEHVPGLTQLLVGFYDGAARSFGDTSRRISMDSLGFYFTDTWKVRPGFTLEYGLRYDISTALEEEQNRGDNFLPGDSLADANGFVPLSARPLYDKDKNNFGPRIGFAWDIGGAGKTVLRGGYTLSYDVPNFGTIHAPQVSGIFPGSRGGLYTNPPQGTFAVSQEFSTPASNQVLFPLNTFCQDFLCVSPGVPIFGAVPTALALNPVQVVTNFQTPIYHSYNLTFQQEITSKTAVSLAYVGGAGSQLPSWRDLNAPPVGSIALGCDQTTDDDGDGNADDFQDRPFFAQFGTTICHMPQLNNDGRSRYNSIQASFQLRNWHNLTGQANFTTGVSRDT
ncbi:MAG: TonB-dependent receptor domain-containing protein, partial [Terriglobales bacterium]